MAHEKITQKPTLLFPDDDEAVLVRKNVAQTSHQVNLKHYQQVALKFITECSSDQLTD